MKSKKSNSTSLSHREVLDVFKPAQLGHLYPHQREMLSELQLMIATCVLPCLAMLHVLPHVVHLMERQIAWAPGYSVSNEGLVFSSRLCSGRVSKDKRKVLKFDQSGKMPHKRVTLSVNGVTKRILVHRLVAEAFLGAPSEDQVVVRHLNGDAENNHVSNLAWGTHKDNEADKKRHGRSMTGTRNHFAKLTWENVRDIRESLAKGHTCKSQAVKFGMSRGAIESIKANRTWVI